jgi:hypothetical protein
MIAVAKLPSPPSREGDIPLASESHHLVRERSFPPSSSLDDIKRVLRNEHVSGRLEVDFSQGGVGTITFHERKKIAFE